MTCKTSLALTSPADIQSHPTVVANTSLSCWTRMPMASALNPCNQGNLEKWQLHAKNATSASPTEGSPPNNCADSMMKSPSNSLTPLKRTPNLTANFLPPQGTTVMAQLRVKSSMPKPISSQSRPVLTKTLMKKLGSPIATHRFGAQPSTMTKQD